MCNLYSLNKTRENVAGAFKIGHNRFGQFDLPLRAIFPGHTAPVVRLADDGARELVGMSWGFVRPDGDRAPKRVTNTRDDNVQSPFWRDVIAKRRCLVPASSFCEPHGSRTPATWHWFAVRGDEPRPLFAFPGIWQKYKGHIKMLGKKGDKKPGPVVEITTYSILTTEPNSLTETINHERSPALLTREEDFEAWMTGSTEEAFALLRPFDAEHMRIVQEGAD